MRIVIYLSVLGRMKHVFSVNSDDVEERCVRIETVLLSGEADLIYILCVSSLLFVLGRSFRLE